MAAESLIGIDIGTTSVKGLMIGLDGTLIARCTEAYPTARPGPGRVEQDPDDWYRRVRALLVGFAEHPGRGRVRGIGFTSQVNTHVFTDAALAPLAPALVWQDTRAAEAAARLDAAITAEARASWFGAPMPVDASNALARMAWLAEAHPERWAATAHVLGPKDHVIARLTGTVAADPLASVGLVGPDLAYAAGFLARLEGAERRLPPLRDPLEVVGTVRAGEPLAGTAVVLGTMDAWAGMFGVGVTVPGHAMYLGGTSEILGVLSTGHAPTPGVVVFAPWRGLTLHAAPTQSGGASLAWVARLLDVAPAEAIRLAAAAAPGPGSPLFLPHLEGERAPFWDAAARGSFAGLAGATGRAELAAAVLEGVALSARLAYEAAERSAATAPAVLRAGGGGMAADHWCQLRADVLGRPLERAVLAEAGALGAAIMAGVATGRMADLGDAAARLVTVDRRFEPDPARHAQATERLALYRSLYEGLGPVNRALAYSKVAR